MRDHVIAAFKHFDKFQADNRLCDYNLHPQGASIELIAAWIFYPVSDEKPLAWIRQCFNYRASLPKKDARGQVIKLGINSIYGKFAQRIGRAGKPPKFASPWYAAAITAGTQRQLIEAALTKPDAIVAFATDGIYRRLGARLRRIHSRGKDAWRMGDAERLQRRIHSIRGLFRPPG